MEKTKMIAAMLIVGSIGIFVNYIPVPSSVIAMFRAVIGTIFILAVILIGRKKISLADIRKNAATLLLSGAALGFNWILLFEAYRHTTVAVATLCYYMAPVFVVLLSPVVLKERIGKKQLICVAGAVAGAVLISGVVGSQGQQNFAGVGFGLAAATLYGSVVLLNKKLKDISSIDTTLCQLAVSAVVMTTYALLTVDVSAIEFSMQTIILLLIVGIIHTGVVYILFFSAVGRLSAQTSAVLSYIDPVVAIILSAVILQQPMTGMQICGTIMILGFTLMNEIKIKA